MYKFWFERVRFGGRSLLGAVLFYTCIPLPSHWELEFEAVSRFAPTIGVLIGAILGLGDWGLGELGYPVLIRSALVVVGWVGITGGLHLDGAMDTADGLAVQDPNRRLDVMADSATGAFGAMAAVALLLLKTLALSEIQSDRALILMTVAAWGRWGQVNAIARYPYLKPTGKGAFHKAAIQPLDPWIALLLPLSLSGIQFYLTHSALMPLILASGGIIIALLTGAWFHHKLGGHTGDTYGAVVEWTEALLLCLLTRE